MSPAARFLGATVLLLFSVWAAASTLEGTLSAEANQLSFVFTNTSDAPLPSRVAAGSLWETKTGTRLIALRAGKVAVPAHASATLIIPAAVLSASTPWTAEQGVAALPGEEKRLEPLLTYLASRNDVPRRTSQLVALALLENVDFAAWRKSPFVLRPEAAKGAPAEAAQSSDTATALDALAILRQIAPAQTFALAADPALKLRALHDPVLRPRALQLYGLTIPGEAAPGGVAPDLGQLLHTTPGDNCPVCRLRQQMQPRDDAP